MTNPSCAHLKVLVVDDDKANQYLMQLILEEIGCTFEFASHGQQAIDMVRATTYDLVLMDLRMPVMDGVTATRIIRADVDRKVPIIAVTAHALDSVRDECEAAGMNGFFPKPFEYEQLRDTVADWLRAHAKPAATETSGA
jgi:CheY-like chemotaxis protein